MNDSEKALTYLKTLQNGHAQDSQLCSIFLQDHDSRLTTCVFSTTSGRSSGILDQKANSGVIGSEEEPDKLHIIYLLEDATDEITNFSFIAVPESVEIEVLQEFVTQNHVVDGLPIPDGDLPTPSKKRRKKKKKKRAKRRNQGEMEADLLKKFQAMSTETLNSKTHWAEGSSKAIWKVLKERHTKPDGSMDLEVKLKKEHKDTRENQDEQSSTNRSS